VAVPSLVAHINSQTSDKASMTVPFLACMASVAAFYHLPPRVLPAIQAVEGGSIGAIHQNRDGSQDLGVMQVNTRWVLARSCGSF
jgi:hypothetical protein